MNIFSNIENTSRGLIGIGDFTHGIVEVWNLRFALLKYFH